MVIIIMGASYQLQHEGDVTPYSGLYGMLAQNEVPFWAPGMGKGSFFQHEVM